MADMLCTWNDVYDVYDLYDVYRSDWLTDHDLLSTVDLDLSASPNGK